MMSGWNVYGTRLDTRDTCECMHCKGVPDHEVVGGNLCQQGSGIGHIQADGNGAGVDLAQLDRGVQRAACFEGGSMGECRIASKCFH